MNNINLCLDGARRLHEVKIHYDQCFEADFIAMSPDRQHTLLVAKGFGSNADSALADLDRSLWGYNADTVYDKGAW